LGSELAVRWLPSGLSSAIVKVLSPIFVQGASDHLPFSTFLRAIVHQTRHAFSLRTLKGEVVCCIASTEALMQTFPRRVEGGLGGRAPKASRAHETYMMLGRNHVEVYPRSGPFSSLRQASFAEGRGERRQFLTTSTLRPASTWRGIVHRLGVAQGPWERLTRLTFLGPCVLPLQVAHGTDKGLGAGRLRSPCRLHVSASA
jgi:hypothetical protein